MKKEVSLVLSIHGNDSDLYEMLISIQNQTMLPMEVIIINSLYRIDESLILQNFKKHLNIKYYFYKNRMFPGASRNKGVEKSSFPLIAFLDSKTVPKKSWLENSYTQLSKLNSQIVFGCTKYKASTEIQKILLISTYGVKPVSTIPGSIFHKEVFSIIGPFKENVRAGEDIEWANRIHANKEIRSSFVKEPSLEYSSISTSLIYELKRSHRNLWSAAKIDAQQNTRMLVLGLISISLLMFIPSWNKFFGGFIYIPNITKIYLILSGICLIGVYLFTRKNFTSVFSKLFLPTLFVIAILQVAYPGLGSGIIEEIDYRLILSAYLILICTTGFLFRALIAPLRLGASIRDLIPFRWIGMGCFGLINDLVKVPGYLFGAIFSIIRLLRKN